MKLGNAKLIPAHECDANLDARTLKGVVRKVAARGLVCSAIVCFRVSSAHPPDELALFNVLTDRQIWIDCGEMQIGHEGYPIERVIEFHTDLFAPRRLRSRNGGDCSG